MRTEPKLKWTVIKGCEAAAPKAPPPELRGYPPKKSLRKIIVGKIILFCKIFENCFSENELSKIDQWHLGYDYF